MRNNILGGVAVVMIAAAVYIFFSGKTIAPIVTQPPVSSGVPVTPPTEPIAAKELNAVSVERQDPLHRVTVKTVVLEKPGFVVIHREEKGAPGTVLGVSALLLAGTHTDVNVALKKEAVGGTLYDVMLHTDNSDGVYVFPGPDVPLKDSKGEIVMAKFTSLTYEQINKSQMEFDKAFMGKERGGAAAGLDVKTPVVDVTANATIQISMDSGNFFFKPAELRVKEGQKVSITFANSGFHTFTIDGLGVNIALSGGSGSGSFTASKKGTFEYYCAIGSHKALGMKGTLVVE